MLENNDTSSPEMNKQQQSFNLTFRRDNQHFLGNPTINVLGNNNISHSLHSGETLSSLKPQGGYHLDISGAHCKAVADFELTKDTVIDIKFNRVAGGIEVFVNGERQKQKAKKAKVIIAVVCAMIALVVLIDGLGETVSVLGNKSEAIVVADNTFPLYGATFNLTKSGFEEKYNTSATKLAQESGVNPEQFVFNQNGWSSSVDSLTKGNNYTYVHSIYDIVLMTTTSDKVFSLVCNVTNPDTLPLYMEMANIIDPNAQKLILKMASDNINIATYKNTQITIGSFPNKTVIMLTSISDQYKATQTTLEYPAL